MPNTGHVNGQSIEEKSEQMKFESPMVKFVRVVVDRADLYGCCVISEFSEKLM